MPALGQGVGAAITAITGVAAREPQIKREGERLAARLHELKQLVVCLNEKLAPTHNGTPLPSEVPKPSNTSPEVEKMAQDEERLVPIAEAMRRSSITVEDLIGDVQHILGKVEV